MQGFESPAPPRAGLNPTDGKRSGESATGVRERVLNERGWGTTLLAALLLLCAWAVVVSRVQHPTKFWNFGYIHDGSLCLQDRCDPFDTRFLDTVGPHHGEPARPALNPEYPVYPPSTLLLAVPLNPFGWPGSADIFFGIMLLAYGAGMAGMVRAVRFGPWVAGSIVLLALLSSRSPWEGLYYANPVMVCAGLMTAACVLLFSEPRRHDVAATVLLALAMCVKPQLAVGAVVFLLWRRDTRVVAWRAVVAFVVFSIVAVLVYAVRLGGFAYLATEKRILALGFRPGHSSDGTLLNPNAFRFLNLEPLMSGFGLAAKAANGAALAITGIMGALVFFAGRSHTVLRRRPWTMLSLLLLVSFMPVYHREYDRCLLLALAPAAMEVEQCQDHRWLQWLIPAAALVWFWSEPLVPSLLPRFEGRPVNAAFTLILSALLLWSVRGGQESGELRRESNGARLAGADAAT